MKDLEHQQLQINNRESITKCLNSRLVAKIANISDSVLQINACLLSRARIIDLR